MKLNLKKVFSLLVSASFLFENVGAMKSVGKFASEIFEESNSREADRKEFRKSNLRAHNKLVSFQKFQIGFLIYLLVKKCQRLELRGCYKTCYTNSKYPYIYATGVFSGDNTLLASFKERNSGTKKHCSSDFAYNERLFNKSLLETLEKMRVSFKYKKERKVYKRKYDMQKNGFQNNDDSQYIHYFKKVICTIDTDINYDEKAILYIGEAVSELITDKLNQSKGNTLFITAEEIDDRLKLNNLPYTCVQTPSAFTWVRTPSFSAEYNANVSKDKVSSDTNKKLMQQRKSTEMIQTTMKTVLNLITKCKK